MGTIVSRLYFIAVEYNQKHNPRFVVGENDGGIVSSWEHICFVSEVDEQLFIVTNKNPLEMLLILLRVTVSLQSLHSTGIHTDCSSRVVVAGSNRVKAVTDNATS